MNKLIGSIALVTLLAGCESLYQEDGIPRIRTQRDVDAYNATVVAANDKLVCSRELVIGTNIRQFVCLTVAQRDRLREQGQEDLDYLQRTLIDTGGGVAQ